MERKFLVEVQFNGKNYFGFQKNDNKKTIQSTIEMALKKLFEYDISTVGSSRTDAGVSAKQFYFTFVCETKLPAERIAFKLNRFLPKDIQCQSSKEIKFDYDLRKDIVQKTYQYTVYDGSHIQPLLNQSAVFIKGKLDVENMKTCAKILLGKHNFKSFCNQNADTTTFEREIFDIKITKQDDVTKLYFTADNFLYNMVRVLAGTLVECGKNKMTVESIKNLFKIQDRSKNPAKTMPAKALVLYETQIKLN